MRVAPVVIAVFCVGMLTTTAFGVTWHILPDGSGDQPTIQAGLNAAASGDTVLVAAGSYHENLFWPFRNGIVVIGSGSETTVVVGDRVEAVLYLVGTASFNRGRGEASKTFVEEHPEIIEYLRFAVPIDSTTVIRGLHFRAGGDAGVAFYGASPVLDSCAVDSTLNGPGIYCLSGSAARVLRSQIEHNNGSGIRISDCDPLLVITQCTISENCSSSYGGGVCCESSSPRIFGNTLSGNSTSSTGGGIHCESSSPMISGNTLLGNSAPDGAGGGICCYLYSSPAISGNSLSENSAGGGGGIFCYYSSPTISSNTLSQNWAGGGGGIGCYASSSTIINNTLSGNSATTGGGITCVYGSPMISNNTLSGNSASSDAGGIYCEGCSPMISDNILSENWASSYGGGIRCEGASPTISGNILSRNSASHGGGIYGLYDAVVLGNILSGNAASYGGGIYCAGYSPTISGNTLSENSASLDGGGIYCCDNSTATISSNALARNSALQDGGALYCGEGGNPVLSFNTLTENTAAGLGDALYTIRSRPAVSSSNIAYNGWGVRNVSLDYVPDCQSNWWGHSTGPWHAGGNPSGQGDSLSTYAWDFIPWLEEPDTMAPPIPPRNLTVTPQAGALLFFTWGAVPLGDLDGYWVHFDTDTLGWPYADSVDVGNVTTYMLGGLQDGVTYYVAVTCYDNGGNRSWYSAPDSATAGISTGVGAGTVPTAYCLGPNVPNPFNPTTTIGFSIPVAGSVSLTVYDIMGRRVATIVDGVYQPGEFTAMWNGRDDAGAAVPSGIYFARLHAGEYGDVRKMVLIR